jgi:hypothetical protein
MTVVKCVETYNRSYLYVNLLSLNFFMGHPLVYNLNFIFIYYLHEKVSFSLQIFSTSILFFESFLTQISLKPSLLTIIELSLIQFLSLRYLMIPWFVNFGTVYSCSVFLSLIIRDNFIIYLSFFEILRLLFYRNGPYFIESFVIVKYWIIFSSFSKSMLIIFPLVNLLFKFNNNYCLILIKRPARHSSHISLVYRFLLF